MARKSDTDFLVRNCKFAFKCDVKWEQLEQRQNPKVRHCAACRKNVYLCETDADLWKHITKNRCVALCSLQLEELPLGELEIPEILDWRSSNN